MLRQDSARMCSIQSHDLSRRTVESTTIHAFLTRSSFCVQEMVELPLGPVINPIIVENIETLSKSPLQVPDIVLRALLFRNNGHRPHLSTDRQIRLIIDST